MDLVVHGGALPTFLLERLLAATSASAVEPRPPWVPEFDSSRPKTGFFGKRHVTMRVSGGFS